jgi:hypothetical protein
MFWGSVIKESKAYKTKQALEDNDYAVLHISNVALPKNAPAGKVHLLITMGKGTEGVQDLTLATLQKDKIESIALDLYVNVQQQITLSVSGAPGAELHLSGFFEPQREEDDDEGMFVDGEEDEEEEEEVATGSTKKLQSSLQQAKTNALKNASKLGELASEDDEDDEEYDDEEEGEDEEDESE